MDFNQIEFPIRSVFESKRIHKIGHPYEFRNKHNKDVYGIIIGCRCEFLLGLDDRIYYLVKIEDGSEVSVDHDINREI